MSRKKRPWFVYWNSPYQEADFIFLDNFEDISELTNFLKHKTEIKQDVTKIIEKRGGQLVGHFLKSMHDDNGWETLSFVNWGIPVIENLNQAPAIKAFLEANTNVLSFSINKLKAGKTIQAHYGDTNAIYRVHFGIDVPAQLPICGFRVKGEKRSWKIDDFLVFCDAHYHEAWNNSNQDRIILSLDIIRPEFSSQRKRISLKVRSFLVVQLIAEKVPFIKRFPKPINRVIFLIILALLTLLYPYQKKHGMFLKHS
jgi:ornithine lipid ester-linked acyl 2-hydroxylase